MTVLVTGGAGYIGSHMVHALADAGESVAVVDNLSTGFAFHPGRRSALHRRRRRRKPGRGRDPFAQCGCDHSLCRLDHRAGFSLRDPLGYYRNNTGTTRNVLASAVKCGVKKFIFSSTAAVYGNPERTPVSEGAPTRPLSPYGTSKLMTEIMLRDVAIALNELRGAALLQCRGRRSFASLRHRRARRDASVEGRSRGGDRAARKTRRVRRRLSDARRHLHPRFHSCERSCAGAPRSARLSAQRRTFGNLQSADTGTATQFWK